MATPTTPSAAGDRNDASEHPSGLPDAAMANLHRIYRGDLGTLQVAIAHSSGEHRRRLETVLANLRGEQR